MSGLVGVRIDRAKLARLIGAPRDRLANPRPILNAAIKEIRYSVANEFNSQSWFPPSGGARPWALTQPFGNRLGSGNSLGKGKGTKKTLIDTGAYFRALMGTGPGGIARITANRVVVGVELATFPYAAFLRGGVGAYISLAPLIIRPRKRVATRHAGGSYVRQWALWWYLGLTYGVWLSEQKLREGLKLQPRPHLTANPVLTAKLRRLALKYFLAGKLS